MKNKKTFVGLFVILALLCLGLGYAAVSKTLTITGSASGLVNDDHFVVKFTETEGGLLGKPISTTINGTSATFENIELTDPDDFGASSKLKIQNFTYDLGAKLTKVKITVDGNTQEYDLSDPELFDVDVYRCRYKTEFFTIVVHLQNLDLEHYGITAAENDRLVNYTWVEVSVGFNKLPLEEQTINFTIDIIAEAVNE